VQAAARPMKILIADNHKVFRHGLRQVLTRLEGGIMTLEANDYPETLAMAEAEPDIGAVLISLSVPGIPWSEGLQALRRRLASDVPIIVLSPPDDRRQSLSAVNLGAADSIPHSSNRRAMLVALRQALSGNFRLPAGDYDHAAASGFGEAMADFAVDPQSSIRFLTPRQRQVLTLLAEGKSNKEIAGDLRLAEGTVKLHVTAILKALNVNNRTRAVVAASQLGLTRSEAMSVGH